jgi:glycosyltransferase involved in cell wall biosynthesis
MRLVHVASGRLFGGIEQMLVTLARERRVTPDVSVSFVVAAPARRNRLCEELDASGATVHALGDVRLSRPASIVRARSRLRQVLSAEPADAVICHAPWSYAIFAPVARRAGIPVLLWQHDRADGRSLVERWAARTRADLVICNSRWTSLTTGALQPGVPVAVVYPPVTIPECSIGTRTNLRRDLGTDPADVVLLCASRLEPWKGHLNLVRALGRGRPASPWSLWIAGAPQRPHEHDYLAELQQEVARLGLEARVRFLGERRDVPMLMRAADLVCQPNEGPEPFGVVFAEALLSGVPVVTTASGGAPEIVSDQCGRLVPPGDLDALTHVLSELIDDAALRGRLAACGPAHAAARSSPAIVLPRLAAVLAPVARRHSA